MRRTILTSATLAGQKFGERGETNRWVRFVPLLLLLVSCDDDQPAALNPGLPEGAFFRGGPTITTSSGTVGAPELPRSTTMPVVQECAVSADAALRAGGVGLAVGNVTYAWLSQEQSQAVADAGMSLAAKTSAFDDRVRLLGTTEQAPSMDAVLAQTPGVLSSWPRFWATRVNSGHDNHYLLQVTLRSDALWIVDVAGEALLVDQYGTTSALDLTLPATVERIAGVFFATHTSNDGECAPPFATRELVITNLATIESWALGTAAVTAQVESELVNVADFMTNSRTCSYPGTPETWSHGIACAHADSTPLWWDYARNLASVDAAYYPNARNLAHVGDLLRADLRRWQEHPIVAASSIAQVDAGVSTETSFGETETQPTSSDDGQCMDAGDGGKCFIEIDSGPSEAGLGVEISDASSADAGRASSGPTEGDVTARDTDAGVAP